jgi:hypothetical protein
VGTLRDYIKKTENGHQHGNFWQSITIGAAVGGIIGVSLGAPELKAPNHAIHQQPYDPTTDLLYTTATLIVPNAVGDGTIGHLASMPHSIPPRVINAGIAAHGAHVVADTMRDGSNLLVRGMGLGALALAIADAIATHGPLAGAARGAGIHAKREELARLGSAQDKLTGMQVGRTFIPTLAWTMIPTLIIAAPMLSSSLSRAGQGETETIVRLPEVMQQYQKQLLQQCQQFAQYCSLTPEQTAIMVEALKMEKVDWAALQPLLSDVDLTPEQRITRVVKALTRDAGIDATERQRLTQGIIASTQAIQQEVQNQQIQGIGWIIAAGTAGALLCAAHHKAEADEEKLHETLKQLRTQHTLHEAASRIPPTPTIEPLTRPSRPHPLLTRTTRALSNLKDAVGRTVNPSRIGRSVAATALAVFSNMSFLTSPAQTPVFSPKPMPPPSTTIIPNSTKTISPIQAKKLLDFYTSSAGQNLQELQKLGGSAAGEASYQPTDPADFIKAAEKATGQSAKDLEEAKRNVASATQKIYDALTINTRVNVCVYFNQQYIKSGEDGSRMIQLALRDLQNIAANERQSNQPAPQDQRVTAFLLDMKALNQHRADANMQMPKMLDAMAHETVKTALALLEAKTDMTASAIEEIRSFLSSEIFERGNAQITGGDIARANMLFAQRDNSGRC